MEFKKLMLVDPRHLQPTPALPLPPPPPPNPVNSTLSSLDLEMKRILYSDLCDSEKVSQYNQILTRYRDTYAKTLSPPPPPPPIDKHYNADNSNNVGVERDTAKLRMREEILHYIPKTLKVKASDLLDRIWNAPGIGWNENGELIVNDNVIIYTYSGFGG